MRENCKNIRGVPTKLLISYLLIDLEFLNWQQMLSYITLIHLLICKGSNSYIHEYSRNHEKLAKIVEQFRGVPRKCLYFQLSIAIEY